MNSPEDRKEFISGFVGVVGFPNVGKSTLVNQLVGQKVSIVSHRPQTTRNRIRGILNTEDTQVIFVDTPGIQRPRDQLERHMIEGARGTMSDVDLIMFVVDGSRERPGKGDKNCARLVEESPVPAILVVNKMDLVPAEDRQDRLETYGGLGDFESVVAASALHGHNADILMAEILQRLPRGGPRYFPGDMATDQPMSFLVAELIREKVLELVREEVPYSTAIQIRQVEERGEDQFYIAADIIVERRSQKGILIGKGGSMIKAIGQRSRRDVEELLEIEIYLDLHVRVQDKWRDNTAILKDLGLRQDQH